MLSILYILYMLYILYRPPSSNVCLELKGISSMSNAQSHTLINIARSHFGLQLQARALLARNDA